jgi:menaquinone-specific isochorismate synthase
MLERNDQFLASLAAPVGAVAPESLLHAARALGTTGQGFWQDGARWIAHAGAVFQIDSRTLRVPSEPFSAVRTEAARIERLHWVRAGDAGGGGPRFHGGFAFRVGQTAGGRPGGDEVSFWESFPSARFVLPRIELETRAEGAILTLTERFPTETDPDEALAQLERRLEEIHLRLADASAVDREREMSAAIEIQEPVDLEEWRSGIERILTDIKNDVVRKVVLARPLDVTLSAVPDPILILSRLRSGNPLSHAFLLQFEADQFFLGAAPELLGALTGRRFRTMAVAGSIPRGSDPESDEWLGQQLLSSRKNRVEHQIVVEDIMERLRPFIREPGGAGEPSLLKLSSIQHLRTELTGEVPEGTHCLDLVAALHPTASVCGYPRETALEVLAEEESVGRGWYAGPVGWFDTRGEGEFAPALRSAVGRGPLLRLHAGAGIVDGSRPGSEWDETRVKLQTVLRALGIARVP